MKHIIKYLRPFWAGIIAIITLLLIQSITDLNLPNYMSNIINIGLQQNGVEHSAPDAISESAYKFITKYMTDYELKHVEVNYTMQSTDATDEYLNNDLENIYVKNQHLDAETIELIDNAFSYASFSVINLVQDMMQNMPVNDMEVKSMKQGIVDTLNGIDRSYSIYEILPENKETYGEISEIISNYNIDGIICLDIKAMEYIAEYREMLINTKEKDNEFKLYGVGNTSKIISFLEQGIINGTAIKNEFSIGYLAVENAIKLKNNKKVSNKLLKSNVVTSENMYSKENERILFQFIR